LYHLHANACSRNIGKIASHISDTTISEVAVADLGSEPLPVNFANERSFRMRVYDALKRAIIEKDMYSSAGPCWIDERQIAAQLGTSRTPMREALAALERECFVVSVRRKGTMVVRKTKTEIVEMIEAWAALESMAARLITLRASDEAI